MTAIRENKGYALTLAVGVLAFLFAIFSEWNDDAIAYSFFIPRYGEDESFAPIRNFADIWNSQINHYFNANGRFVVHVFVQLFCGLAGKFLFALCNAAVWIILLKGFIANRALNNARSRYISITLAVILLWWLPFTPPFQINYVWVSCAIVYWIRLFFKDNHRNWLILIFLGIFSFISGELHEGFSIPVSAAIITYFIARRCSFTSRQWIMAICFGIGSFVTILAPGNFYRMNVMEGSEGGSMLNLIEQLPSLIWFPAIYLLIRLFSKPIKKANVKSAYPALFFTTMIIVSALFNLYLGRLGRGIIPYNLAFIFLIMKYVARHKVSKYLLMGIGLAALGVVGWRGYETRMQNNKTRAILREYTPSADGRIYISDDLFLFNIDETCQRRNTYTNLLRSQQGAEKSFLVIYPESIREVNIDKDTNMVLQIGPQSWICVRSATSPADFIVEKTLLPGILNKSMAPRTLDFSSASDIFIDSTGNNTTIVYTNRRPYMNAAIRQTA
ncbi:MAG: hypothetical protein K2K97_03010, partial [Muribaculaceae bacterium]|nr:hypothetical protein [Muribaculaceae bacterium]